MKEEANKKVEGRIKKEEVRKHESADSGRTGASRYAI
jgi:hypothetical protein